MLDRLPVTRPRTYGTSLPSTSRSGPKASRPARNAIADPWLDRVEPHAAHRHARQLGGVRDDARKLGVEPRKERRHPAPEVGVDDADAREPARDAARDERGHRDDVFEWRTKWPAQAESVDDRPFGRLARGMDEQQRGASIQLREQRIEPPVGDRQSGDEVVTAMPTTPGRASASGNARRASSTCGNGTAARMAKRSGSRVAIALRRSFNRSAAATAAAASSSARDERRRREDLQLDPNLVHRRSSAGRDSAVESPAPRRADGRQVEATGRLQRVEVVGREAMSVDIDAHGQPGRATSAAGSSSRRYRPPPTRSVTWTSPSAATYTSLSWIVGRPGGGSGTNHAISTGFDASATSYTRSPALK